jgi:hypothetical protein
MLPTQRDSPTSATSGVLILEPHAEASQKKHLDMPEPFSPTFTADQSGGQPIQKDVAFEQDDELSEDAHCDDQANSLDAVDFVSDFVDKLFTSAPLRPMEHLDLNLLTPRSILEP